MADQRDLHAQAQEHFSALEGIIDELKQLGPHPLDGRNAILNIAGRADCLIRRSGVDRDEILPF